MLDISLKIHNAVVIVNVTVGEVIEDLEARLSAFVHALQLIRSGFALVSHQVSFVSRLGSESTRTTAATAVALSIATRISGRGSSSARVVV